MASDLKPVYLLTGSDRPKIRVALSRLRARFDEDAVEILQGSETGGEAAVATCNALGLFASEGRLVLVEGVEAWKAADVKALAGYLAAPTPGTTLALVGEEAKADGALGKECAKTGDVLLYDLPKRNALPRWVTEQFARRGAKVELETARLLVDVVGEDADALESEVEKLVTWARGAPIGEREVAQLAAPTAETPSWDVTDAWGKRRLDTALRETEAILERSHRARRDEVPKLAAALTSQIEKASRAKRLAAEGVSPARALAELGVRFEFQAKKAFDQAANYEESELREAVVRMAQLDRALKGGSRLAPDLELTRALVDVTRSAESGGRKSRG